MKQTTAADPYWTHNPVIGEGDVQGQKSLIRLHLHRSEERAYHGESLFPIGVKHGDTKTYFHAKPYIIYTEYEPIYDNQAYQTFLAKQGYRAIDKGAFVKEVT